MEVDMSQKIALIVFSFFVGSLCIAAGHVTNTSFNEMIEKTTLEQKKTASHVNDCAQTEAAVQNYLLEKTQSRAMTGSY
jgi:hypothetical protein